MLVLLLGFNFQEADALKAKGDDHPKPKGYGLKTYKTVCGDVLCSELDSSLHQQSRFAVYFRILPLDPDDQASPTCYRDPVPGTIDNSLHIVYGTEGDDLIITDEDALSAIASNEDWILKILPQASSMQVLAPEEDLDDNNWFVLGLGGDDTIIIGTEHTACGGSGNDTIRIHGKGGTVYGESDNDLIYGTDYEDTLYGGRGHDVIYGYAINFVTSESGSDDIYGGSGDDRIYGSYFADHLVGSSGIDLIEGSHGDDSIHGSSGNDILSGQGGEDFISGGSGNDLINGGDDNDALFGEAGHDKISGNSGTDLANGGSGRDYCSAETVVHCE
jgi:Ca2+-binding RTX toxin-like protein